MLLARIPLIPGFLAVAGLGLLEGSALSSNTWDTTLPKGNSELQNLSTHKVRSAIHRS